MLNPTNFLPKKKRSHPKSVRRLKEQALRKGGLECCREGLLHSKSLAVFSSV